MESPLPPAEGPELVELIALLEARGDELSMVAARRLAKFHEAFVSLVEAQARILGEKAAEQRRREQLERVLAAFLSVERARKAAEEAAKAVALRPAKVRDRLGNALPFRPPVKRKR
jgi:hypothetical protein